MQESGCKDKTVLSQNAVQLIKILPLSLSCHPEGGVEKKKGANAHAQTPSRIMIKNYFKSNATKSSFVMSLPSPSFMTHE